MAVGGDRPMIDYDHQSIFESDAVLASQFFTPPTALPDPERALMVAVLEDGVRCFLNYYRAADRKQRILYEEARAWLLSAQRTGLYAFENVCDVLGVEPGYLRRQLLARRDERHAHGTPVATPHFSHRTHRAPGSGAQRATG